MVHVDPLIQVVAPADRPDQKEAAEHETFVDAFLAWDILSGKEHPELGGSPEILDIVGCNNYSFGQMEYREQGPHQALPPGSPASCRCARCCSGCGTATGGRCWWPRPAAWARGGPTGCAT
jgi:hypothetical protein